MFFTSYFTYHYYHISQTFKIYSYNGMWYAAPLHTQKMLLFIMQKGMINVDLRLGSVFTASLEGFAMVKLKILF